MTPISLEFFPPKNDKQQATLDNTVPTLLPLNPEYGSVTFGAGGSTIENTPKTVRRVKQLGLDAVPHISCLGGKREELAKLLDDYRDMGCKRVVALRGDIPADSVGPEDLKYASDLVAFIRERYGDAFQIEVGCYPESHPESEHAGTDLHHFVNKVKAGADGAITQYFFNPDGYFRCVDEVRKAGLDVPIVPGIMPISNFSQLQRFSGICGAEIPRWIETRMLAHGDDKEAIAELGADIVADICQRLIDGGAPGLHMYTLNRAKPTLAVMDRLGMTDKLRVASGTDG